MQRDDLFRSISRVIVFGVTVLIIAACTDLLGPPEAAEVVLDSPGPHEMNGIGTTLQLSAEALDGEGSPIEVEIGWTSSSASVATVDGSGLVTAVAPGTADVTAMSGDARATARITVRAVAEQVAKLAGGAQTDTVLATLAGPLRVRATDGAGNPAANAVLDFRASHGGTVADDTTDADGVAEVEWTLGSAAGEQTVEIYLDGGTEPIAAFAATARAGAVAGLEIAEGNAQSGRAGHALDAPLAIRAHDAYGNDKPGVAVSFDVLSGGGTVEPAATATDENGTIRAAWTLGSEQVHQRLQAVAGDHIVEAAAQVDTRRAVYLNAPDSASAGSPIAVKIRVGTSALSQEVRGALVAMLRWDAAALAPDSLGIERGEDIYAYNLSSESSLSIAVSTPTNTANDEVVVTVFYTVQSGASGDLPIQLEGIGLVGATTFNPLLDQVSVVGDVLWIH